MSIEKITSKIVSDAESIAQVTLDEAKAECDAILARAESEAEKVLRRPKSAARKRKKLISRRKAVADIDGRKIILEEKQKLITECFDRAIEQILPWKRRIYCFSCRSGEKTGETEGELILNERMQPQWERIWSTCYRRSLQAARLHYQKRRRTSEAGFY